MKLTAMLVYLNSAFPQRKFFIVEEAPASNGPHVELPGTLGMEFILGANPDGNEKLFEQVLRRQCDETLVEWHSEVAENGSCHVIDSLTGCH